MVGISTWHITEIVQRFGVSHSLKNQESKLEEKSIIEITKFHKISRV